MARPGRTLEALRRLLSAPRRPGRPAPAAPACPPGPVRARESRPARTAVVAAALVLGTTMAAPAAAQQETGEDVGQRSQQEYAGYLFTYFTGEDTADGEQVYLALSRGNDPLHWQELNGAQPVLRSEVGERGVRDPFVIRSPEGDRFYLIATDLRIHGNGNWDHVQRHGSRSIVVWESTDLVEWTDQRLVEVAPPNAGNVWAPEAFYDSDLGAYVVFWASKLYPEDDPDHTANTHNRMMYSVTEDFLTFSEPQVWIDPGYSVIDSTVIEYDGYYYRFTKDERGAAPDAPCGKFITAERATALLDPGYEFIAECIGSGALARGEGPTVFASNTEDKWYLFIDEFGGRGYVPFETTDLASGEWTVPDGYDLPRSPRHGTVLPVTAAEYGRLLAEYGEQGA